MYQAHGKLSKKEMLYEINDLRQKNVLSTKIFSALASDHQVPAILRKLRNREDLAAVAHIIDLPPLLPSPLQKADDEDLKSARHRKTQFDPDCMKDSLIPSEEKKPRSWTAVLPEGLLIKHLISLYCVWIHPAYPILSIPNFLGDYETGEENHCSAFLVNAICAVACDLLTPQWEEYPGSVTDTAVLQQKFIAEAAVQKASANLGARTTLLALAVLSIMDTQSKETLYCNTLFGEATCWAGEAFKVDRGVEYLER